MGERVHNVQIGKCEKGICGEEAACQQHPNETFVCLCPHDMQPPTTDGRCPTRKTVPLDPRKIENILPPQNNDTKLKDRNQRTNLFITTMPPTRAATSNHNPVAIQNVTILYTVVAGTLLIVSSIVCLILLRCWYHKKRNTNLMSPSPIQLKRNLLLPDRYAPNPQYAVCTSNSVQILRKEQIGFIAEIGEGCFGKVFKGELRYDHSEFDVIVAVKVLKESASREAEEDFLREVDIMSAFRHENILTLVGVVLRDTNVTPMMVFEYMPHGDLAELLRNQNNRFDDQKKVPTLSRHDLMSIALQIANGMMYLASQRFVHRDLACRNCLVASGPMVKIADFGMSRDVYTCDYYKIGGSRLLPVRWMSPESVIYGRFTLESDTWSFGVVLWEIYTYGKQPYYGHTNDEVVKLILQGIMLIPPDDCPSVIRDLMRNCWKTEPRDRIKFTGICEVLNAAHEEMLGAVLVERPNSMRTMSLPRPPPLPNLQRPVMSPMEDLVDPDGYLLPKDIKESVQYLEALPA